MHTVQIVADANLNPDVVVVNDCGAELDILKKVFSNFPSSVVIGHGVMSAERWESIARLAASNDRTAKRLENAWSSVRQ